MAMAAPGLCMGCMSSLGDTIVCPQCGYDNGSPYDKNYRKPGSVLSGRYILGRLVRKNGEGALYVGFDNSLQCRVWIREYFPSTLASRDAITGNVLPLEGFGAQYKALMSDFVDVCNEVRRLGVTEPVIPIENVVGEHGTVYAVYKDLAVIPLESWLNKRGGKLPVAEARELLMPLLNTLSNIHARSDIHRGVSPFTVYVDKNDKLYLWDFCISATRTGGSELTAELFNGYSAPEQYASNGWQGTWTDVYGAAALFYRTVSGFVPPKSTLVGEQRPLAPLIDLVMDLPRNISDAVADAMNPSTERRTQEIGTFVSRLTKTPLSSTAIYDSGMVNEVKKAQQKKQEERAEGRRRRKYMLLGMLLTVAVLALIIYMVMTTFFPDLVNPDINVTSHTGSSQSQSLAEGDSGEDEDSGIPNFIGAVAAEVQAEYGGKYTISIQEDFHEVAKEGTVFDQSPEPGTVVNEGRTVILHVSKGKRLLIMPDFVGMDQEAFDEAIRKLSEDGKIDLTYVQYNKYDPTAEPGTVVSTTPAADTEFNPKDTRLTIFFMPESSASEASSPLTSSAPPASSPSSKKESSRMTQSEFEERWGKR